MKWTIEVQNKQDLFFLIIYPSNKINLIIGVLFLAIIRIDDMSFIGMKNKKKTILNYEKNSIKFFV